MSSPSWGERLSSGAEGAIPALYPGVSKPPTACVRSDTGQI